MSSESNTNNSGQNVGIELLSRNLCWLMKNNNVDVSLLKEKTDIAITTLNNLRRGVGNPTYSTLIALSGFFNISVSQLTETDLTVNYPSSHNISDIPLISLNEASDFLANRVKSKEMIAVEIEQSKDKCFAVKIHTNVLSPFFEKGTIFVINPSVHPQDGDIVLVQFAKQHPCFRRVFIEGNSFFFKSLVDAGNDFVINDNNYIINGVIITAIQNFHLN